MQPQDACSPAAAPLHALSSQQTVNLFFSPTRETLAKLPKSSPVSLHTTFTKSTLFFSERLQQRQLTRQAK